MSPGARVVLITVLLQLGWAASIGLRRARSGPQPRDVEERIPLAVLPESLALWRWDARKHELSATERFHSILGLSRSAPLTRERARECILPDDRPQFDRFFADAKPADPHTEILDCTFRVGASANELRWIASKARIWRNARGQVLRASGIVLDISEHKRSEQESERQQEQLAHLTRVAILGQLSGALAHELNQPLASILSNAQAAQHHLSQEPVDLGEVRAIVDDIVSSDKRAGELIRRLREMLRRGGTQIQQLDLRQVVGEVLALSEANFAARGVEVSVCMPHDLCAVGGDRVQIQQVFLNLLLNACEAMSQSPARERLIEIVAENEGDAVHVRVLDHGVGIPACDLEGVFDAFYTTKSHGLGLGLAISRSIITTHGGRLWATPNKGHGSCFHLTLPTLSSTPVEHARDARLDLAPFGQQELRNFTAEHAEIAKMNQ